jgi:hypothetical protein
MPGYFLRQGNRVENIDNPVHGEKREYSRKMIEK